MFEPLNAVQVRITIEEIKPPVWRRLVLPLTWDLTQLHLAIQAAFNWWNYHLQAFRIAGLRFGDPADEGGWEGSPRLFDEREVRLRDFDRPGARFFYVFDFGDNWRHAVEIEKFLALDAAPRYGTCIAGALARPPEDVGGTSGYEEFPTVMGDPDDPEHASTKCWCGGHFDPEFFRSRGGRQERPKRAQGQCPAPAASAAAAAPEIIFVRGEPARTSAWSAKRFQVSIADPLANLCDLGRLDFGWRDL